MTMTHRNTDTRNDFSPIYLDALDGANALIEGLRISRKKLADMVGVSRAELTAVLRYETADPNLLNRIVEIFETVRI